MRHEGIDREETGKGGALASPLKSNWFKDTYCISGLINYIKIPLKFERIAYMGINTI